MLKLPRSTFPCRTSHAGKLLESALSHTWDSKIRRSCSKNWSKFGRESSELARLFREENWPGTEGKQRDIELIAYYAGFQKQIPVVPCPFWRVVTVAVAESSPWRYTLQMHTQKLNNNLRQIWSWAELSWAGSCWETRQRLDEMLSPSP